MLQTHLFGFNQVITWDETFEDLDDIQKTLTNTAVIIGLTFGNLNKLDAGDILFDETVLNEPSYQIRIVSSVSDFDGHDDYGDGSFGFDFCTETELIEYGVKMPLSNPVYGM